MDRRSGCVARKPLPNRRFGLENSAAQVCLRSLIVRLHHLGADLWKRSLVTVFRRTCVVCVCVRSSPSGVCSVIEETGLLSNPFLLRMQWSATASAVSLATLKASHEYAARVDRLNLVGHTRDAESESRPSLIERQNIEFGPRKSDKNALHCSGFPSWSDDFFRARASMRRERFSEFSVHRSADGSVSWSRLNGSCWGREKTQRCVDHRDRRGCLGNSHAHQLLDP